MSMYKALTIAGSDCSGGAGIQADIKTFQELSVYGMSVITVLTAQNTLGVQGVYPQSIENIGAQIDSVLTDIGTDAVKTGMLYSADIIQLVAQKLKQYDVPNLIVDPVMIAKGGAELLQEEAIGALKKLLFPMATVITPNIPEACRILNIPEIKTIEEMHSVGKELLQLGPKYVLLKGGHLAGEDAIDLLFIEDEVLPLVSKRIETKHTHGTGCTLASALTAQLAKGHHISDAARTAKKFITAAITDSLDIGKGIGPTNHAAYRRYIVE